MLLLRAAVGGGSRRRVCGGLTVRWQQQGPAETARIAWLGELEGMREQKERAEDWEG